MNSTAIYVRVSTDEQAKEGYSIRAQIEKLKNYIQIKDWGFYKVYADEGISGKNIKDRPAINELIADVRNGNVNNVLVYKIDRLTRSTKDLIELTEIFNDCNCTFNSLMESIDTQTASGRMFLKIIGIFAEFERENIIERVTLACEKKVKEGYTLATFTPSFGYNREIGEKIQTINPEEAKIVNEIYTMYLESNMSYNAIAKNLNHRGIKPKLVEVWGHASVRNVLRNANYIGKVRYGVDDKDRYFEVEGKHQPIISEELFYEVQNKMGKIGRKSFTKRPREDNYFSGTVYCALCDARLISHAEYKINKKGERVINGGLRCPNIARGICNASRFSHRKMEVAIQQYMESIEDIAIPENITLEEKSKQESINALLREEYESAIAKLIKKEKDIMTLYINERVTFEDYEQMARIVSNEKKGYMEQLNNIQVQEPEDILLVKEDIVTSFRENWKLLTNGEKLRFLRKYIEKITAVSSKDEGYRVKVMRVEFYRE